MMQLARRASLLGGLVPAFVGVATAATGRKAPPPPTVSPEMMIGAAVALVLVTVSR
jgi:hypothetical protein